MGRNARFPVIKTKSVRVNYPESRNDLQARLILVGAGEFPRAGMMPRTASTVRVAFVKETVRPAKFAVDR